VAMEGQAHAEDATPASLSNLDALLADAQKRSGTTPQWMEIEGWGRADSKVTIGTAPDESGLRRPTYVYSGASGAFIHQKPGLGTAPSAGGAASDLIGPLHFGDFAGTVSRTVWFSLGLCLAYVTLSGMLLWTQRRQEVPVWRRLGLATIWVGYGLPVTLLSVALAYFLARAAGFASYGWMLTGFLSAVAVTAVITSVIRDPRRFLLTATGTMLLVLPLVRWISGGPSWAALADSGLTMVIVTDLAILVGGAWALRSAHRAPQHLARSISDSTINAPGASR